MRILIEHARDLDKLEKVFAKSKYDYNVKLESEHGKTTFNNSLSLTYTKFA